MSDRIYGKFAQICAAAEWKHNHMYGEGGHQFDFPVL